MSCPTLSRVSASAFENGFGRACCGVAGFEDALASTLGSAGGVGGASCEMKADRGLSFKYLTHRSLHD